MTAVMLTRGAEGRDRRGFSVADVFKMIDAGVIGADEKFELIEGEIVPMSPEASRHVRLKNKLGRAFNQLLDVDKLVAVDSTLYLSKTTFVEPDLYIVLDNIHVARTPPSEVFLVCEIAASSLSIDHGAKASLYARHGVPELWLIEAETLQTTVYREPGVSGYGSVQRFGAQVPLQPERLPGVSITLTDLRM